MDDNFTGERNGFIYKNGKIIRAISSKSSRPNSTENKSMNPIDLIEHKKKESEDN